MKLSKAYRFVMSVLAVLLSLFMVSSCDLDEASINLDFAVDVSDVTFGEDAVFVIKYEDPGYEILFLEMETFLQDKKTDYVKPIDMMPFYHDGRALEKKCYVSVDENWEMVISSGQRIPVQVHHEREDRLEDGLC